MRLFRPDIYVSVRILKHVKDIFKSSNKCVLNDGFNQEIKERVSLASP